MTVDELIQAKLTAELALANSVQSVLDKFHEDTGIRITGFHIEMATQMATSCQPKTLVTNVELDIPLTR